MAGFTACGNVQDNIATEQPDTIHTEHAENNSSSHIEQSQFIESDDVITTTDIENELLSEEQMPNPFGEDIDCGGDQNASFYQPCNRGLDNIPVELVNLRDPDDTANWFSSFPAKSIISVAPDSINEYKNIYSFITHFDITKEEAETALTYYLNSDDKQIRITREQLDIIFSKDVEIITQTFASEYSIVVGECIYCPNWIYTHSVEEYNDVGITVEDINAKSDLYSNFGFTDEARTAFSNKLSNYTGTAINLNIPVFSNTDNFSENEDLIEDSFIIEDDNVDIIVEEPAE